MAADDLPDPEDKKTNIHHAAVIRLQQVIAQAEAEGRVDDDIRQAAAQVAETWERIVHDANR